MTPHAYPAYRPSAVPWLGDVPAHWDIVRLKYAAQINPETLSEDTDPEYLFDYMDINSVGTGYMSTPPVRQVFGNAPSRARRVMRTGDTAISTVRTYLKAAYHLQRDWPDLISSTGFAVLRPPATIVPALLGHTVQSDAFVRQVVANSVGVAYPAISETKLGALFLVLPPLPEQHAIVRYLDHVDRRIRRYVRAKRRLVALLEEERQAIVSRAVTRGLDTNVRLKPSGVEWLGDVPEHWEVRRLRTVAEMRVSNVDKHTEANEAPVRLCNYVDVYKNDRIDLTLPFMSATASQEEIKRFRLKRDDVLITKDSEEWDDIGVPALVTESAADLLCGYHLAILRPFNETSGPFLARTLQSKGVAYQFNVGANGVTRYGLTHINIQSVRIPFPPLPEQTAIVEYLDKTTAGIDAAIARARRQIELVEEYRTSLIADVVTGKLDVREAAAQLPEEADGEEPMDEGDPLADDMDDNLYDGGESAEEPAEEDEVRA